MVSREGPGPPPGRSGSVQAPGRSGSVPPPGRSGSVQAPPVRAAASRAWTTPPDVVAVLRRRWESGQFLAALAAGEPFAAIGLPLRGPAAGEIADRFTEVAHWVSTWERASPALRVERGQVGGRVIGFNEIPRRAWIDSDEQLWDLLKVRRSVRCFTDLAALTKERCPLLAEWVASHPIRVLDLADDWERLLATVTWIDERQRPGEYLRQVDVPGVDTKFIERHMAVLAALLDRQLGPDRIDDRLPRSDFARRYRFAAKPQYVRFRLAVAGAPGPAGDGCPPWLGKATELSLRVNELVVSPAGVTSVYVVENEVTYLAFPLPAGSMVIFGGGYAAASLDGLAWLDQMRLCYWGDIDTHGFAILNRLRHRFGHATSMLMDRGTLLAHADQWVSEPAPLAARLDLLQPAEAALYHDLVTGNLGQAVRLEQERVSFAAIAAALSQQAEPARSPLHGAAT